MTGPVRFAVDDESARQRIRHSLGESLLVEASAGTGKTQELVLRMVRVLAAGNKIEGIAAVTFTNKAAGELKLRLRQELDIARAVSGDSAAREHLEDALERLEEAAIGTIHSFCAQILRERPVEACVDPAFQELTEPEAARLYQRAFRTWFEDRLSSGSPVLRRCLTGMSAREPASLWTPLANLEQAGRTLVEWRDYPGAWRSPVFDRENEIDTAWSGIIEIDRHAATARRKSDVLLTSLRPLRDLIARIQARESGLERDYDELEGLILRLPGELTRNFRKGSGAFSDSLSRDEMCARIEELKVRIEELGTRADASLAHELRDEMSGLLDGYERLKHRAGKLDFLDLLIRARDLLRNNGAVRNDLQRRFSHLFVDEFQDTDPLQTEILLLLAAADPSESDWRKAAPAPGKLFLVGDPKQSIYKFRRADIVLYETVRQRLEEQGVAKIRLTRSRRSVPSIQQCVNAAFHPEMRGDPHIGQPEYIPMEEYRPPIDGQPGVIALPVPEPYGSTKVTKTAINQCLPETVIAFVDWLVHESDWVVSDPAEPGNLVPVAPRHVCLLFRRFVNYGEDLTREYARALEARNIPHMLAGSKSFHQREEVETLRTALTAIEWPDDELSVFATLKGSLFAIDDAALLRFRHEVGRLTPFHKFPAPLDPVFEPVRAASEILAGLHRERNRRPIAATLHELLEATRAHAGFAFRPGGDQVLANVLRVCDLARNFEATGGLSFRGFVEELTRQAERTDSSEAAQEDSDGVRLMTVHAAKGLEFPVVILADITANIAPRNPERYIDSDRDLCAIRLLNCAPVELNDHVVEERAREVAEGVRVAYVAATRARDLLVIPAVGDQPLEQSWIAPLHKAIYPARADRRSAEAAPGCPRTGNRTVLRRPFEDEFSDENSVRPGLHTPELGDHKLVWWDPATLRRTVEEKFGLRQEQVLSAEPASAASTGLASYEAWMASRESALAQGVRESLVLRTVSEMAGSALAAKLVPRYEVEFAEVPRQAARPGGRRFGSLVHAVLQDTAPGASRETVERYANVHGRLLGADPDEVGSAAGAVQAALAHPWIADARQSDRLHLELPFVLRLDDAEGVLEGVIDFAYLKSGLWTVVDFKTDSDVALKRTRYEEQVRWYALALSRIMGAPVKGRILSV